LEFSKTLKNFDFSGIPPSWDFITKASLQREGATDKTPKFRNGGCNTPEGSENNNLGAIPIRGIAKNVLHRAL
jgi:hypothetical protein